jgi:hypothetical protein
MKAHEEARTFDAPIEAVRSAASDALTSIGCTVATSSDGTTLSGRTGWSLFSFGENAEVVLDPQDDGVHVTVRSAHRLRTSVLDLGSRNQKNVGSVLASMASRLPS